MTDFILLDLNATYAENASQVHLMHKGIYNVEREFYRPWLTKLIRKRQVLMLTSRPERYKARTLEHIQKLEDWQPQLALFNGYRLKAPDAKKKMLEDVVFPKFGQPGETSYVAIESNIKTSAMFERFGIRAYRQEMIAKQPSLLDGPGPIFEEGLLF
jgi:hypothetical protein